MARTPFKVEVLTPEGEVFNDEVEMVSTRTTVGSIGVLAHHQPLLGILDPTELRLYRSESDIERFLSQPFHVAEQFAGTDGAYVPIAETVRSFRELIDGEHDELPESAFLLKGSIDQVVESAKK